VLAVLDRDRTEALGDAEVIAADRGDDPDAARDRDLGGDGADRTGAAETNTRAPSSAKRWAVASPIPDVPPVTRAVLPSRCFIVVLRR
jgi:hypothetical protein